MKVVVLSVRDALVGFGTTFTAVNEDVAMRGFKNSILHMMENGNDDITDPTDLSLYLLGEFDTNDGVISPCEPRVIARGHSIISEYHAHSCNCTSDTGGDVEDDN